ncbi:MAG: HupE/UreJ family protein [Deltaproteobacteria bacterium]|nr:HupE/UreJ family protein [Deltaproteobacteria bacterium]
MRFHAPFLCAVLLAAGGAARAHTLGKSFSDIHTTGQSAAVILDVDPSDLAEPLRGRVDNDNSGLVDTAEIEAHLGLLSAVASAGLVLSRGDVRCTSRLVDSAAMPAGMLRLRLSYTCEAGGPWGVELPLLSRLRPGHVHFATLRLGERTLAVTLTSGRPRFSEREASVLYMSARFLVLGLEHIVTGYDHLLFLFALLLVAARLRQLVLIVTSFTLAHTLTLVAAGLGWFTLSSRVVEPAIAATIVYVAVENLLIRDASKRFILTFALGLVHGLGFAGILSETGLPAQGRILALVSFNVGVEIGQLAIVSVVVPLIAFVLRARPHWRRPLVWGGSGATALTGAVLLVQRVSGA